MTPRPGPGAHPPGSDRRFRVVLDEATDLPGRLAELGVAGGAVYHAQIALITAAAGAEMRSLGRQARPTYERCGVQVQMLA